MRRLFLNLMASLLRRYHTCCKAPPLPRQLAKSPVRERDGCGKTEDVAGGSPVAVYGAPAVQPSSTAVQHGWQAVQRGSPDAAGGPGTAGNDRRNTSSSLASQFSAAFAGRPAGLAGALGLPASFTRSSSSSRSSVGGGGSARLPPGTMPFDTEAFLKLHSESDER